VFSKSVLKFLTIIAAVSFVGACQSVGSDVGKGPLNLSLRVQAHLAAYMARDDPHYFAVSEDGWNSGYVYCSRFRCDDSTSRSQALQYCEVNSRGVPCKIYARGKYVLWENASAAPVVSAGKQATPQPAGTQPRPLMYQSNKEVCDKAVFVRYGTAGWKNHISASKVEAEYRGLSPEKCARTSGLIE